MKDKKAAKLWVKALRSGRYKQCRKTLATEDGRNCCLAVLCRVMRAKKVKVFGDTQFQWGDDTSNGALPNALREELGISPSEQSRYIDMNDPKGFTFDQIADYVEARI